MASPSQTIRLCKILSDSRSIIRSHLHHFLALTVLFIFPLSLCLLIYPTIQTTFLSQSQSNFIQLIKAQNQGFLMLILIHTIFAILFSLCSVATISYSTFHAVKREPVDLIASIKFILNSFFPLLSTTLVSEVILALISIPFLVLLLLIYKWLHLVFIMLLMYLQVNWTLAYVVVKVESKWGYEPLEKSAYFIQGNRGVALSMLLYFGLISGGFFWGFYVFELWRCWFLLYVIFGSVYLSFILLFSLVANVVLFVYSSDLQEGLPFENTRESIIC